MTKTAFAFATAMLLGACAPQKIMQFSRLDGRSDQPAQLQYQQDKLICAGEVAKAQAVAAPIYTGPGLAGAMEAGMLEGQRNQALKVIMVGCMAQRGYSMTLVDAPKPQ
jgi:hypothetical protein